MAIRILTEEDKRELEQAIAEAAVDSAEVDLGIQAIVDIMFDGFNASGFIVTEGSIAKAWRKAVDSLEKPVVSLHYPVGSATGFTANFHELVSITAREANNPEESYVAVDFTFRQAGKLYSCCLISQGESNIADNRFTEFEMQAVENSGQGSGGDVDLTGYATESWVRQGYQPKGSYLTEVPDGYATEDFVEEKIAQAATGGTEVDVAILSDRPIMGSNLTPSGFTVVAGSLAQAWRKFHTTGNPPIVALYHNSSTGGDMHREYYGPVRLISEDCADPHLSYFGLDFTFRWSGILWSCSLISEGESNIENNKFTTVTWTAEDPDRFQPKGDYLAASALPGAINTALAQAKDSGEFDGEDGYTPVRGTDYWTATDIAEIKSYVDEAILGGAW